MDLAESRYMSEKEAKTLIEKEFSDVKNLKNELEAYYDTYAFMKESVMLEHDYAGACGSNYDRMLIEYREKKYVINDKWGTVKRYENTLIR